MMKEQNIPQDSLIAGYLPADYCDSFSRNVVSEKAITSDEFFDMAFTVVKFNNRLGRLYFFFIRPFHKVIIRSMLKRVAKRLK